MNALAYPRLNHITASEQYLLAKCYRDSIKNVVDCLRSELLSAGSYSYGAKATCGACVRSLRDLHLLGVEDAKRFKADYLNACQEAGLVDADFGQCPLAAAELKLEKARENMLFMLSPCLGEEGILDESVETQMKVTEKCLQMTAPFLKSREIVSGLIAN